jgi:hypothetical protein
MGKCTAIYNTTGSCNLFFGTFAGHCNSTGFCNIFLGFSSGCENTTGKNNILIGINSGTTTGGITGGTITNQSNYIILGNDDHTCALIQPSWTVTSDIRDKCIFGKVPHGKGFLSNINPIIFSFKNRKTGELKDIKKRYGFSAQEILEIEGTDPVIVSANDPEKLGLTTDFLLPILVNAIKELSAELDTVKLEIEELKRK